MSKSPVAVFWFRRDLRIEDNHGLARALSGSERVLPVFIFDRGILETLESDDPRVSFIHKAVVDLDKDLRSYGSRLRVYHGKPIEIFARFFREHKVSSVFLNEDYEPYAIKRDQDVAALAKKHGIDFRSFKDHVLFAKDEIVKENGTPYQVFTPYARRWLARFEAEKIPEHPSVKELERAMGQALAAEPRVTGASAAIPSLLELGFKPTKTPLPEAKVKPSVLKAYAESRDFLALDATTKIGVSLRFGTISIRVAARMAAQFSSIWLKELIWREFFQMILFHFPHTVHAPFDQRFESFPWRNSPQDFKKWQEGETGYPIVDAGMRELNQTGFMHNRARMIVGSFLCKHLLLDWRLGERYFAAKLFDFELASNVGNWQWVAGCGVDAAPYFRIFNPRLQTQRFDKDQLYIRRWMPEAGGTKCFSPLVDHEFARRRALVAFARIKNASGESKGRAKK